MTIDYFSAFLIGVLGSSHCIGMCGGIISMLTTALPNKEKEQPSFSKFILVLFYHFGRISSYTLIGAIVGFTGSLAAKNIGIPLAGMRLIAAIFLIFLGLYIGQWLMWINRIEYFGKKIWQLISPMSKRIIPVDTPLKAIALGTLWGWLPCGLVYSTLTWSLASGNVLSGALIMTFFGLGTLPALLSISLGTIKINKVIKNHTFRKIMALSLIIYGIYSLNIAYRLLF